MVTASWCEMFAAWQRRASSKHSFVLLPKQVLSYDTVEFVVGHVERQLQIGPDSCCRLLCGDRFLAESDRFCDVGIVDGSLMTAVVCPRPTEPEPEPMLPAAFRNVEPIPRSHGLTLISCVYLFGWGFWRSVLRLYPRDDHTVLCGEMVACCFCAPEANSGRGLSRCSDFQRQSEDGYEPMSLFSGPLGGGRASNRCLADRPRTCKLRGCVVRVT